MIRIKINKIKALIVEKNNKIIRKKLYYIYARKDNNNFLFEVRGGSLTFFCY